MSQSVPSGEIYSGYSQDDIRLFDLFSDVHPEPEKGFVKDFLGTRTRTTTLWDAVREFDGKVLDRPVPFDFYEAIEWVGLLKAVTTAQDRFRMMELGAGWGPWLAAGANAARLRGIKKIRLLGVEADPGRFELMRQHFRDNNLDTHQHILICGAVGVDAGRARWPKIYDPANAGGARPVRERGGKIDRQDADYMGTAIDSYIDVEIRAFAELLGREDVWNLVHIDVQGWEAQLCAAEIDRLSKQVSWVVVATHSRPLDGEVIRVFHDGGWVLENEKPTRFQYNPDLRSIEQMATVDGTQVWRNPRLAKIS